VRACPSRPRSRTLRSLGPSLRRGGGGLCGAPSEAGRSGAGGFETRPYIGTGLAVGCETPTAEIGGAAGRARRRRSRRCSRAPGYATPVQVRIIDRMRQSAPFFLSSSSKMA